MAELCPICNGSKHRKEKKGEGSSAQWVFVPCKCVLAKRLKIFLGPFSSAPRIDSSPLVGMESSDLFCGPVNIENAKTHIAHFLRRQGLKYQYRLVDISALAAMYVSDKTETEDSEYFKKLDLLIVFLNLVSLRSNKADDLLTRAISWRQLVSKPVWIFSPGSGGDFRDKFRQASTLTKGYKEMALSESGGDGEVSSTTMDTYGIS